MKRVKIIGRQGGDIMDCDVPVINVTSRSTIWSKGFSPFLLTDIPLGDGTTAKNMENAWQYSKLYPQHADKNGEPTQKYFDWARKGFNSNYAKRYPMGRFKRPICSLWKGERLSYVEARKKIYIPLYAKAVVKTEAYKKLKKMYDMGEKFVLWDFDGYDYISLGMTYEEVANNEKLKMGHAFVIGMLLEGMIEVINGKIKYNKDYLEK